MLESAVGFVSLRLGAHTGRARFAVMLDIVAHERPSILLSYELQGLVLSGMSGEDVIVFVAEYSESEVVVVRDVDSAIEPDQTVL